MSACRFHDLMAWGSFDAWTHFSVLIIVETWWTPRLVLISYLGSLGSEKLLQNNFYKSSWHVILLHEDCTFFRAD